jgi:hypothetical protein
MTWHAHGSRAPRLRQQAMHADVHQGGSVIVLLPVLARLHVLFRRHVLSQLKRLASVLVMIILVA